MSSSITSKLKKHSYKKWNLSLLLTVQYKVVGTKWGKPRQNWDKTSKEHKRLQKTCKYVISKGKKKEIVGLLQNEEWKLFIDDAKKA